MKISYRDRMSPDQLRQFDEARAGIRARDYRRSRGVPPPLPHGFGTSVLAIVFIGIPIFLMLRFAFG